MFFKVDNKRLLLMLKVIILLKINKDKIYQKIN